MTLVISAVTASFAILATDRRIQWITTTEDGRSEVEAEDDSDTKSFVIDQRYLMGFAGLGRFYPQGDSAGRGQRLEGWVLGTLSGVDSGAEFRAIAEGMGPLCESVRWMRPHAFVAVGFEGEDKRPRAVTITNSKRFPHSFDVADEYLNADSDYLLRVIGTSIDDKIEEGVRRNLETVCRWAPDQPRSLHVRFVKAIRAAAKSSSGEIGEVVTVTSLPRSATPTEVGETVYMGYPVDEVFRTKEVSWTYWPDGRQEQDPPARAGQGILMGGARMLTGAEGQWPGPLEGFSISGDV